MELKIKRMHADAHIPKRATLGAAGVDLCVCGEADYVLQPMERRAIATGIAIELPDAGHVGLVFARSGLSLREGLTMANGVGVIDSDYRGEILVPMVNLSPEPVCLQKGARFAQLLVVPVVLPDIVQQDNLTQTQRGAGGFGSTGIE